MDLAGATPRRAGSTAAKVCDGGGCVLFLIDPDARARVSTLIERAGAVILSARVALQGVQVKTSEVK